jgi:Histidine kinase
MTHAVTPSPNARSRPSFWLLQLIGWSGYYAAMAFSRIGRFPIQYMLAEKLLLSALGFVASLVLRIILRRMLARATAMQTIVAVCVVVSYVLAAVWTAVANVLTVPIEAVFLERTSSYDSIGALFGGTVYNSFTLVAWGFLYLGLKHYIALEAERERALRAEAMVSQVRLRALQSQLNPHLFFNTLNAISTLIVERRNDDAALMIARLGDFLRATLREDLASKVPLAEELSLANQYLDIEQIRFGDRLRVTRTVDEDAYRALVPLLLFQPLIENATRHGIAHLASGGTIAITAQVLVERLAIVVENGGPVHSATVREKAGMGLANVRERLTVLYGDQHAMTTTQLPTGGFRVEIVLPLELAVAG